MPWRAVRSKMGVAVTELLASTPALAGAAPCTRSPFAFTVVPKSPVTPAVPAPGKTRFPASPLAVPVPPALAAAVVLLPSVVLVVPVAAPVMPLVPGLVELVLLITSLLVVANEAVAELPEDAPLPLLEAVAGDVLAGLVGVFAVAERVVEPIAGEFPVE